MRRPSKLEILDLMNQKTKNIISDKTNKERLEALISQNNEENTTYNVPEKAVSYVSKKLSEKGINISENEYKYTNQIRTMITIDKPTSVTTNYLDELADRIYSTTNNVKTAMPQFGDSFISRASSQTELLNLANKDLPSYIYRTTYFTVMSEYRNVSQYPYQSNFNFRLYPSGNSIGLTQYTPGHLKLRDPSWNKVIKLTLVDCIFPDITSDDSNFYDQPFVIINIDEIPGVMYTPVSRIPSPFAILPYDNDKNIRASYLYSRTRHFFKEWAINSPYEMKDLTFSFMDKNGELVNFGLDNFVLNTTSPVDMVSAPIVGSLNFMKTITFTTTTTFPSGSGVRGKFFNIEVSHGYVNTFGTVYSDDIYTLDNPLNQNSFDITSTGTGFSIDIEESYFATTDPDGNPAVFNGIYGTRGGIIIIETSQVVMTFEVVGLI